METGCESCFELGILTEEELKSFARVFSQCLDEGDIVILSGEIGSGKTTFVRGLVTGLGCSEEIVTSPTFTLMNVYACSKTIYHLDAYRLNGIEDVFYVLEGEIEDKSGVFIIEWGNLIDSYFIEDLITVFFEHEDEKHRKVTLRIPSTKVGKFRRCLDFGEYKEQ